MRISIEVDDGVEDRVREFRDQLVGSAAILMQHVERGTQEQIAESLAGFERAAILFAAASLAKIHRSATDRLNSTASCDCPNCKGGN